MTELKPKKGFVKSINFSMQTLQAMKKHCKTEDQVKTINFHIGNMQKLKNCVTFALSDNSFDFSGTLKEIDRRLVKGNKDGN